MVQQTDLGNEEGHLLQAPAMEKPMTPGDMQRMNEYIYGERNRAHYTTEQLVARLVEETGEVSEAFRHERWDDVAEEMADVLGWTFTLANRMGMDLADVIWERYPYACPDCKEGPCACKKVI